MSNFYRIILGKKNAYFQVASDGGFVGVDFGIHENLAGKLPEDGGEFVKQFIPVLRHDNPAKSRVAAGAACWALWRVSKKVQIGDIVLCPDGIGTYHLGEVTGNYSYAAGQELPHRRSVRWLDKSILRADMSEGLQNTTGSIGAVVGPNAFEVHRPELERFLGGGTVIAEESQSVASAEDPSEFALEKHLEDFLVTNWDQTSLSKEFSIFEDDGELVGQKSRPAPE